MNSAPTLFGLSIRTTAADLGHLGGALVVTISVICMGEVLRIGRFLNVLLGLCIAVVPWFLQSATTDYSVAAAFTGLIVAVLAIPRGPKTERYGRWDRYVL